MNKIQFMYEELAANLTPIRFTLPGGWGWYHNAVVGVQNTWGDLS